MTNADAGSNEAKGATMTNATTTTTNEPCTVCRADCKWLRSAKPGTVRVCDDCDENRASAVATLQDFGRRAPMTTPDNLRRMTATDAYCARRAQCEALMATLLRALDANESDRQYDDTNWGHVGSLGYVADQLTNAARHLNVSDIDSEAS